MPAPHRSSPLNLRQKLFFVEALLAALFGTILFGPLVVHFLFPREGEELLRRFISAALTQETCEYLLFPALAVNYAFLSGLQLSFAEAGLAWPRSNATDQQPLLQNLTEHLLVASDASAYVNFARHLGSAAFDHGRARRFTWSSLPLVEQYATSPAETAMMSSLVYSTRPMATVALGLPLLATVFAAFAWPPLKEILLWVLYRAVVPAALWIYSVLKKLAKKLYRGGKRKGRKLYGGAKLVGHGIVDTLGLVSLAAAMVVTTATGIVFYGIGQAGMSLLADWGSWVPFSLPALLPPPPPPPPANESDEDLADARPSSQLFRHFDLACWWQAFLQWRRQHRERQYQQHRQQHHQQHHQHPHQHLRHSDINSEDDTHSYDDRSHRDDGDHSETHHHHYLHLRHHRHPYHGSGSDEHVHEHEHPHFLHLFHGHHHEHLHNSSHAESHPRQREPDKSSEAWNFSAASSLPTWKAWLLGLSGRKATGLAQAVTQAPPRPRGGGGHHGSDGEERDADELQQEEDRRRALRYRMHHRNIIVQGGSLDGEMDACSTCGSGVIYHDAETQTGKANTGGSEEPLLGTPPSSIPSPSPLPNRLPSLSLAPPPPSYSPPPPPPPSHSPPPPPSRLCQALSYTWTPSTKPSMHGQAAIEDGDENEAESEAGEVEQTDGPPIDVPAICG